MKTRDKIFISVAVIATILLFVAVSVGAIQ